MNSLKPALSLLAILLILISSYLLVKNNQVTQKLEDFNNQISILHSKIAENYAKLETIETDINDINNILILQTEKQPPSAGDIKNTFYIDPINGSANGDGSKEAPWGSLQEVIDSRFIESRVWSKYPAENLDETYLKPRNEGAPIKGGDTIYLMSGNYGDLSILKYYNTEPITIRAYPGQTPVFSQIKITSSANWVFENIAIDRTGLDFGPALFLASNHGWTGPSWNISLINSHLTGSKDIKFWGLQEWLSIGGGIRSSARNFTASGNTIENVRHAILSKGENSVIEYNTINQFAFDGIRGFGSNSVFQFNLIKNSVYTDYSQNHDDAFQSWSLKGKPQEGIILHGNIIIDNYDLHKSDSKFLASRTPRVQGIGLFDGPFWNWQITDNVIVVSSNHGISTDKLKNATISGNIIIPNPLNLNGGTPWISLGAKTGTDKWPVKDNVITDNIMSREIYIVSGKGIKAEENTVMPNYISPHLKTDIFEDFENGMFELSDRFTQSINEFFKEDNSSFHSQESTSDSTTGLTEEPQNYDGLRKTHEVENHRAREPKASENTDSREIKNTREAENNREMRSR